MPCALPQSASAASTAPDCAIAARTNARAQGLGGIEQLLDGRNSQNAGALEAGVIDLVGTGERAGMRSRRPRAFGKATGLDGDDRLGTCRDARRRHEFAGMRNRLDIEQDRARSGVGRQVIQHVAEIDIGHVAHRDDMGEADAARLGPVE